MPDQDMREKVIKGLECCSRTTAEPNCEERPYNKNKMDCDNDMMHDAIALLKEQEPVIPKRFGVSWFCGNCKTKLVFTRSNKAAYCWRCGKAVKWE